MGLLLFWSCWHFSNSRHEKGDSSPVCLDIPTVTSRERINSVRTNNLTAGLMLIFFNDDPDIEQKTDKETVNF